MEWSNYLFARGGEYMNEGWESQLTSDEAKQALNDYITNIKNYGPVGAESFSFDEAFNVFAQGNAYSYITYNFFRASADDPASSQIVGKNAITAVPGVELGKSGSLNGAWGWAIPKSSPNPEAAWEFLKWVESKDVAVARAMQGGSPTRTDVFDDPEVLEKYPHMADLKELLVESHNFPTFTYTPQFVEALGRELSLAVAGGKSPEEALAAAAEEFNELAEKDGK